MGVLGGLFSFFLVSNLAGAFTGPASDREALDFYLEKSRQTDALVAAHDPQFQAYAKQFHSALQTGPVMASSPQAFTAAVYKARVVFYGDIHDDRDVLMDAVRWMRGDRGPMVIGIETIFSEYQNVIDDFVAGRLSETELKSLHVRDDDFSRFRVREAPYLEVLRLARLKKRQGQDVRVMALESAAAAHKSPTLPERDGEILSRLQEILKDYPNHQLHVFYGVYHILGTQHLQDQLPAHISSVAIVPDGFERFYEGVLSGQLQHRPQIYQIGENIFVNQRRFPVEILREIFMEESYYDKFLTGRAAQKNSNPNCASALGGEA